MRRGAVAGAALGLAAASGWTARTAAAPPAPPPGLADTGLYADPGSLRVADGVLPYAPQYPLWSDGATKRRWVWLPPGAAVDATRPDRWVFPAGTRFWKEFSFGRRVETRFMEKQADGTWLYATYLWDRSGRAATLAPERGVPEVVALRGGAHHDIPSRRDCQACHASPDRDAPLGFDALQLSPDRDPAVPHAEPPPPRALDLAALEARGLLRHLPPELRRLPPRIPARSPGERAALGYLRANCASCHAARGALSALGLSFEVEAGAAPGAQPVHRTAVGRRAVAGAAGSAPMRIAPGDPERSAVVERMRSHGPAARMPPLGTQLVDEEAVRSIAAWIGNDLRPRTGGGEREENGEELR